MLAKLAAKGFAMTLSFVLFSLAVFAQKTITGKVTGPDNAPVYGATVSVKGTKLAATTAQDGSYSINVPDNRNSLVITYVGFETTEVSIAGKSSIDVGLKLQTSNLNEVIVTGYTAQRKKEITGSVSVVSVKDMKSIPAGSAEQMLQGQASGVTIITSGNPGDNSNVFIRGVTSLGGSSPLVVVDGVPSAPNDLSLLHDLSANDIESVQVIKDAQAAIYGARGSAGVILITTKRGKSGRAVITYDAFYGTQRVPKGNVWGKANTQQMADLYWLAAKNSKQTIDTLPNGAPCVGCIASAQYGTGLAPRLPDYIVAGTSSGVLATDPSVDFSKYNTDYSKGDIYQIVAADKVGTDWFHSLFKPAPIQSHTLTASGGSDKSNYLFSVNFFDQKGILMNTGLKRYSARINTTFNVKNNIRVGENVYVFYKENPRITNNVEGNEVNETAFMQPIIPLTDIGGGFAGNRGKELGNSGSPYAQRVRAANDKGYNWDIQGNVWAEVDLIKHILVRTSFGGNIDNYAGFYHGYHTYENAENNTNNSFNEYAGHRSNWTWTNTAQYSNVFAKKHSVKVLVGLESADFNQREVGGQKLGYFSDDPNYLNLSNGSATGQSNYSFFNKKTLYSILARIDYAYADKFFLGLNGRQDKSSVFSEATRTGNFGSVSAGWQLSQEEFMKGITWLNSLKLRASYGVLGSISNTTGLNSFTTYGAGIGSTYYGIAGAPSAVTQGFSYATFGNESTKWESDIISNVGIDASILQNKIDFSIEYYQKKINGLLFQDQAPGVVGGATQPNVNIGDIKNTGVDFSATYHGKITKDISFNLGGNITAYKNTVVRIPGTAGFFTDANTHNTGPQVRNQAGHPVGSFFGYHIIGMYRDADDVAKSPTETDAAPGRFKYEDANHDGKIDQNDRIFFGNPNPKFTYGFNLNLTWKQFDFASTFYGSSGNKVLNYTRYFQDFYPQFQNAKTAALLTDSWTPTNLNAKYPIVENASYFSTNGVINDFYMENGSFFRCKQMQIGYNFTSGVLKRVGMDRARLYVQAANLFTITKYSGLDPELTTNGSTTSSASSFGVDYGNYPPAKTFNVGVNIAF
ncbi:MAG: TonB-dependent receptor [Bacteroidota bacterium]